MSGAGDRRASPPSAAGSTRSSRRRCGALLERPRLPDGRARRAAPRSYVVNTCTVTGRADFSDRQAHPPRRAASNPDACAGRDRLLRPDRTRPRSPRIAGVDLVVGNQEKYRLPELLGVARQAGAARGARWPTSREARTCRSRPSRRVDGPLARLRQDPGRLPAPLRLLHRAGRARRQPEPGAEGRARAGARRSSAAGYPESRSPAWTSATTAATSTRAPRLAALLAASSREVHGLRWLRLSSVLPAYFTPELIEAVTTLPAMAPHLHLPLQSGSDRVLRLMRRPYTRRACTGPSSSGWPPPFPASASAPTSSSGIPGETDADFEATLRLVERAAVLVPARVRLLGPARGPRRRGWPDRRGRPR